MAWMSDPGPVYDAVRWMVDNGPWMVEAAQDPTNWPVIGGAGAVVTGGGALAIKGASAGYQGAQRLAAGPGAVALGRRRENKADYVLNPLVMSSFKDRCAGTQVIGSTGSGKTTFFLPLAIQDLMWGHTVVVIEVYGDLGTKLIPYAEEMGIPTFVVDASDPSSLSWNPLVGQDKEAVAARMAAVMESVTDHPHFQESNYSITKHMVSLGWDAVKLRNADADLWLLLGLLADRPFLEGVLDSTPIDRRTRAWFSQYLRWPDGTREEKTSGIVNRLDKLLSTRAAKRSLCPAPGARVLDLDEALSYPGALVVMRFPVTALEDAARTAAALAFRHIQAVTYRRGTDGNAWPLALFLDEMHTLVGRGTAAATQYTQDWVTLVRKHNVAVTGAFQSYDVLPDTLSDVVEGQLRNLIVAGGASPRDARRLREAFGVEEVYVEDERHTYGSNGQHSRSRGRRPAERYRRSMDDLRLGQLGTLHAMLLRNGNPQRPVTLKVSPPSSPQKVARHRRARRARARREAR